MPKDVKYVHVHDAIGVRSTGKALLIKILGKDDTIWIPRSQISEFSEVQTEGDTGVLEVQEWLAREKGLEYT